MKAALVTSYGDAPFQIADTPSPDPGDNEVLIRIKASALNPFDLMLKAGYMAAYIPLELPAILGGDAAGVIEKVGSGVADIKVGDRVIADFSPNGHGAQAEYGVAPVSAVTRLPGSLTFAQGAALVKAGQMGRQAVEALGVQAGARVLVSGGLGAVGRVAIQYLREIGAVPVAGVRAERLEEARQIAEEAIDITVAPTGATFGFAISAAAPVADNLFANVFDGGVIASVVPAPEGARAGNRVTVYELYHHTEAELLRKVAQAAADGKLTLPVAGTFSLTDIDKAYAVLAAGAAGKIVLEH